MWRPLRGVFVSTGMVDELIGQFTKPRPISPPRLGRCQVEDRYLGTSIPGSRKKHIPAVCDATSIRVRRIHRAKKIEDHLLPHREDPIMRRIRWYPVLLIDICVIIEDKPLFTESRRSGSGNSDESSGRWREARSIGFVPFPERKTVVMQSGYRSCRSK